MQVDGALIILVFILFI